LLLELLHSEVDELWQSAAFALGILKSPLAGGEILELLSKKVEGKYVLIDALGELKFQPAVESLIEIASSDDDDEQVSAIEALGKIDDESSRAALTTL